jgi:hypothetical protein
MYQRIQEPDIYSPSQRPRLSPGAGTAGATSVAPKNPVFGGYLLSIKCDFFTRYGYLLSNYKAFSKKVNIPSGTPGLPG